MLVVGTVGAVFERSIAALRFAGSVPAHNEYLNSLRVVVLGFVHIYFKRSSNVFQRTHGLGVISSCVAKFFFLNKENKH